MSAADRSTPTVGPARSKSTRSWPLVSLGVIAGITLTVLALTLWKGSPSRQEVVAERGAVVMPFDLEATTHVFEPTETGGIQIVVAHDPGDSAQIDLVREHLLDEAERFRRGDFGDPATIHGHEMPGLAVLESSVGSFTVTYREVPTGAEITYRSTDPEVVQALHDWFAAQLADHGDHATGG